MSSFIPPAVPTLSAGSKLDRYELLCPIAQGGMGMCWLARLQGKHGFEKLVAIKTMKPEFASDAEFRSMFLDEARIAAGIEHTNVAQILDLGEQDGVVFLVMEYVDGDSLFKLRRELLNKSLPFPCGVALRLMADTLGGLHAAHELADAQGEPLGVVHRDVSPQNILVNTKGVAKLIDFGIAKARARTSAETATGLVKGKLHFMSPEQALGSIGGGVDRRADVYSVGAVLYFLLGQRYAFESDTEASTVLKLVRGSPPLPLPKSVPGPIASVVFQALAFDKERRFETAAAMQEAIESAMVKTGHVTTTVTAAAFIAEHMGERAQARKKMIETAAEALTKASAAVRRGSQPDHQETKVGIGPPPAPPGEEALDFEPGALPPLQTDPGSHTIGGAMSSATPTPSFVRGGPTRRVATLGAGAVGLALIGFIAFAALHRSASQQAEAAPAADPSVAARAPEPPPSTAPASAEQVTAPTESAKPIEVSAPASGATPVAAAPRAIAVAPKPAAVASPPTRAASPSASAASPSATAPKKKRMVDDGF